MVRPGIHWRNQDQASHAVVLFLGGPGRNHHRDRAPVRCANQIEGFDP
jgi:hypothetical protein